MYYGLGLFYDPTYILVVIGAVICLLASARVKSTFQKYSNYRSTLGMTGREAAEQMLQRNGIYDVQVVHIPGQLTDHYDPRNKTLALSDPVYNARSVAAIGVAAHECGHAIQHQKAYVPLRMRAALVPAANFGSAICWPLIIFGFFITSNTGYYLIMLGILLFSLSVLFQLVTLPVEFDASHRALVFLRDSEMLNPAELKDTRKVLSAAALTYVASAAAMILQLLRLILISGGRRRE
ncbi:MAG: zinc metallopeptidase [Lachnospiraceae bacterium]|nr:zinc metallopeptidase [Lachnospiraceae bacterium]